MKQDTKSGIDIFVLQIAVATLLAKEAKTSSVPLQVLQDALITQLIDTVQTQVEDHLQEALEAEVAMTNSVDHLFGMAAGMLAKI